MTHNTREAFLVAWGFAICRSLDYLSLSDYSFNHIVSVVISLFSWLFIAIWILNLIFENWEFPKKETK